MNILKEKIEMKQILVFWISLFAIGSIAAQTPSIAPSAIFSDSEGNETSDNRFSGSAPVTARFSANPSEVGDYSPHYEWRFYTEGNAETPYLIRYEENTSYTFTRSGVHYIVCYATFTKGADIISFTQEYWQSTGAFQVSISESKLEMPNAFSPNGDGINDIYKAKSGYQSIIEFHGYIFNRWGQKLYDWTDINGGWDGRYKGKEVKQGVYFCLIKAKGADGREFHIKRDVNLLRGYTERSTTKY